MIRQPLPTSVELAMAREAFGEAELAEALFAAESDAAIAPSRLLAFARGDRRDAARIKAAMLANPALRRLCRHMIESGATHAMPEAIAASSAEFPERRSTGCRVRVIASRSGVGAYYIVVELEDGVTTPPSVLMVCDPDNRIEQVALSAPVSGTIQVMVDEASGIPAMLRNPKSAIFLR
jgi:hypothetical protein